MGGLQRVTDVAAGVPGPGYWSELEVGTIMRAGRGWKQVQAAVSILAAK